MLIKLTRTAKSIKHHSLGRTRIKIPKSQRHKMHQLKDNLAGLPGINKVEMNQATGSMVVHHDHDMPIFEILHKTVENVGTDMLTALIEGEAMQILGPASLLAAGVSVFTSIGKSFISAPPKPEESGTNKPLLSGQANDLKTIIPAALLAAAAYKAYMTRSLWQGMAPMVLAYWAFDTYWKFNVAKPDVFEPRDNKQSSNNGIIAISKTDCPP